jgi:predicted nucleic acid-binding Zn ribbon protein
MWSEGPANCNGPLKRCATTFVAFISRSQHIKEDRMRKTHCAWLAYELAVRSLYHGTTRPRDFTFTRFAVFSTYIHTLSNRDSRVLEIIKILYISIVASHNCILPSQSLHYVSITCSNECRKHLNKLELKRLNMRNRCAMWTIRYILKISSLGFSIK